MAFEQRIESLKKKHAYIDHMLHEEEVRLSADDDKVHELKRRKLKLRDEMVSLMSGHEEAA
jgi:hypothetical protein